MTISPYDQETRQQAVRLYFEELADGASSKAAALRAVEVRVSDCLCAGGLVYK
ncbi:hypothetical protein CIP100629_00892 [Corynebacterium diphtheriae]|nr:hypothetical protein CIP100629_00892 [Corynebacterium diphtheriae]CAB0855344.1 hypothetical protein FRC0370_00757 [Corynebacterium diphtheriae]CAB0945209.1 hypothetical protein FRC0463_00753 [Corynebacterium diphtheriae]